MAFGPLLESWVDFSGRLPLMWTPIGSKSVNPEDSCFFPSAVLSVINIGLHCSDAGKRSRLEGMCHSDNIQYGQR
jgi:hypothetical protein